MSLQPNIRLRQGNMVIVDDYFYSFNHISGYLLKINADGVLIKAYSVIGGSNEEIDYVVYDGFNFWTLEKYGGYEDYGVVIRKWKIEQDSFCKLIETKNFTARSTKTKTYVINDSFTFGNYTDRWVTIGGSFNQVDGKLIVTNSYSTIQKSFFYVFDFVLDVEYITITDGSYFHIKFIDTSVSTTIPIIHWSLRSYNNNMWAQHWVYIDGITIDEGTVVTYNGRNDGRPNDVKVERSNFKMDFWFNDVLVFSIDRKLRNRIDRLEFVVRSGENNSFDRIKFFADQGTHKYKSKTFALEYYNTSFKTTVHSGNSYVSLQEPYEWVIESGDVFSLGPNIDGMSEVITVSGYLGNGVYGHPFYTTYTYEQGDPISIAKHIWLFNDYAALEDEGALYKCNANTNEVINYYRSNNYKSILSCAFSKITEIAQLDDPYCLLYTSGQTIKFLDIYDVSNIYCSMLIDNYNGAEIFDIFALCVDNGAVYRLQSKIYYFGTVYEDTDYTDLLYNFQRSPLRNFIETLSFSADPVVLPNTGINRSELICLVKDQYSYPVSGALVKFSDTSATGYVTFPEFNTNTYGQGITYYVSGIEIDTITITVEVIQVDYIEYVI